MAIKLNYIGSTEHTVGFKCNATVDKLEEWYQKQDTVQLDTETNVTSSIVARQLRVIQLGAEDGQEVYVIQWSYLSDDEKARVLALLADRTKLKIIQNASFEYQILLKYGIIIDNVWDTKVMEQCIYAGYDYDLRFFSLAEILQRRLRVDISKELQTSFDEDKLTDEQITYAATDVIYLGQIRQQQRNELIREDLLQLAEGEYNENEAVLAFSDIEYNGMGFNRDKWLSNIDKAEPIVTEAKKELAEVLSQEPYLTLCQKLKVNAKIETSDGKERKVELPGILPEDTFTVNWNSSPQVKQVLDVIQLFPNLHETSALRLKEYLQENDPEAPKVNEKGKKIGVTSALFTQYINTRSMSKFLVLKLIILKEYEILEKFLKMNFNEVLQEYKIILPKGEVTINWNSNDAKLAVFKWFNPEIENTTADTVADNIHLPFFQSYKKYNNANSLLTKYGESFVTEHVDADGRVRTRFNTVLSTGRVSSSSPNVQQIPKNALPRDRQSDYRSCFYPGPADWVLVDADFASQEICVIATLSGDPVFLDALRTGKDLHSVSAYTVLGDKWKNASAEISGVYPKNKEGVINTEYKCEFFKTDENGNAINKKCECPQHQVMRQNMKAITFGLIYGLSPKGLSADLKVSIEEAEELFADYFKAFPRIKNTLDAFASYGVANGFIRTLAPFRRKRYFPYWKGEDTGKSLIGQIERASKNMPIQGSSSDMVKIALIELRRWINRENLRDKVKLFVQLHDEVGVSCHKDIADVVSSKLVEFMEGAAKLVLGNDLLKTELEIKDTW